MPIILSLLDGVRWQGEPVVGDRPKGLLAALAASGRLVPAEILAERVWGDALPANATKALQVLVSRTRSSCGPESVMRDGVGYRLGIRRDQVDSLALGDLAARAASELERDPATAGDLASEALRLGRALTGASAEAVGPLADVRRVAHRDLAVAGLVLARSQSRTGEHAAALGALEQAAREHPDDEGILADLLRSESAVRSAGSALTRYEAYREGLRDRLGTDPGEALRRIHHELIATDRPVREGVHYESSHLLGRDGDLRRLNALTGSSRVVSIVGAGGLGKTRLAHVLGRRATQPVVHFVELVGVTAGEDVVGEVGSSLGVRDSVSGRRTLTPEQRLDVRTRIAQQLDASPTLLILDNCEHVIEAVAELVAFLVATTRELRVLTTTRAPLAIGAERVYLLGELSTHDAGRLFVERAVAARPGVQLDDRVISEIVTALDGLPLAIELAAAKVRVMSVADVARRLENRFALLRGGDRSAPDRHRTLLAVIDWSWNLLGDSEKRALRWLSLFHDGFTLEAAETVLGPTALDAVQNLADQSLLSVVDSGSGHVRYRMLETVREFGRMQLVDAGEDSEAMESHRCWAVDYSERYGHRLFGEGQLEAVDALREEESNLSDVLRQSLAAADRATLVRVLAALGAFWSIMGDHGRVIVLADAIADTLTGWSPEQGLEIACRGAVVVTLNNTMIAVNDRVNPLREILIALGPGDAPDYLAAMAEVMIRLDPQSDEFAGGIAELADSPNRYIAGVALQWLSHAQENEGDIDAAITSAERALRLTRAEDGPWAAAILRTHLSELEMQLGRSSSAVDNARRALPVLERLGARDDALQLRSLAVLSAIIDDDLPRAEAEMVQMGEVDMDGVFGGRLVVQLAQAELALARGDIEDGLRRYDLAVDRTRALNLPGMSATGFEPWVLFGESTALAAYAHHGPADPARGNSLYASVRERLVHTLDPTFPYLDYPVGGLVLFSLGAWGLLRGGLSTGDSVRLLALANKFSYNRTVPTMSWDQIEPMAEKVAPGELTRLIEEFGDRRGPELLDETRRFVAELPASL